MFQRKVKIFSRIIQDSLWNSNMTHARLDIDGYKYVLNFNPDEINLGVSGKRGVAIYHMESLKVSEVEFEIDGFMDHKWIEVSSKTLGTLLCGCIYRSPSDSDKKSRMESSKVTQLIKMACQRNTNLIIT